MSDSDWRTDGSVVDALTFFGVFLLLAVAPVWVFLVAAVLWGVFVSGRRAKTKRDTRRDEKQAYGAHGSHYQYSAPRHPHSGPTHHLDAEAATKSASAAKSIAAVLRHVAVQEGVGSTGWEHAKRILVVASDGALSLDSAHLALMTARYSDLAPDSLPEELKRVLIRATLEIAIADGVLTDDEEAAIVRVIGDLGSYSELAARHMLATLRDVLSSDHDPKKTAALQTLGLSDDATTADIREAYLALVRQHHPDLASPAERAEATAKAAEINAAYDYLMGVAAT